LSNWWQKRARRSRKATFPPPSPKYQKILQIAPRLAAAYNNLGMLFLQQHDLPQAVAVLEKGLKIDPSVVATSALLGSAQFFHGTVRGRASAS